MAKILSVPKPPKSKSNQKSIYAAGKRIGFFAAAIIFSGLFCFGINQTQFKFENYLFAQISSPDIMFPSAIHVKKEITNSELDIDVKAAVSLRTDSNGREKLFFKKNAVEILPIASLTKLMSAVVVSENTELFNPNKKIEVSISSSLQEDVPVSGNLRAGESYSVSQLLELMLYYSSNDAAWALSEIAGTDKFVDLMNKKGAEIGLKNTFFINPHGLDSEDGQSNYSSVEDILVLVKYILKNHLEIFPLTVASGNYLTGNGLFNLDLWNGQILVGGKTGYTEKAGGCMVVIFKNENQRQFINIVLGAKSSESRVVEMQKLINFANNADKIKAQ